VRALLFLLGEALVNLRRHRLMTIAAITTLAVALALFGAFLLATLQANHLLGGTVKAFEIRVFCRQGISKAELTVLEKRLAALPGVEKVDYLSRDAIFAEQTQQMPLDARGIPNLMPDTFVVRLDNPKEATAVARAARALRGQVENVDWPEQELQTVVRIAEALRTLGAAVGAALLSGALIVVANTIRLSVFARRREIKIMQIVGATGAFIRLPLLIEGIVHGLIGGVLASGLLALLVRATHALIATVPVLVMNAAPIDLTRFCLLLTAGGVLLGAAGSLLSIRRYLGGS
jgi:cell division transport system permease protein